MNLRLVQSDTSPYLSLPRRSRTQRIAELTREMIDADAAAAKATDLAAVRREAERFARCNRHIAILCGAGADGRMPAEKRLVDAGAREA